MVSKKTALFQFLPKLVRHRIWWLANAALMLKLKFWFPHLYTARTGRHNFMREAFNALWFNGIDGEYLEFGTSSGTTFDFAHQESRHFGYRCKMWAFDSFEGLPPVADPRDEHPMWLQGHLSVSEQDFCRYCDLYGIDRSVYTTVPGFFSDSLSGEGLPKNICMAYVDCDMYSSTVDVLNFLMSRLKHGMILAFDDYNCWSSTQPSGQREAVEEAFSKHKKWKLVPFRPIGWHGESFFVQSI